MKQEQSKRIQTSVLNGVEKKVLVWLAERQPRWMTSDILTGIGVVAKVTVALAKGKHFYDKRDNLKDKDNKKEIERAKHKFD